MTYCVPLCLFAYLTNSKDSRIFFSVSISENEKNENYLVFKLRVRHGIDKVPTV